MQTSSNHSLKISPIPAFTDNYIWAITKEGCRQLAVVDPGCASAVIEYIEANGYELHDILVTHRHPDHVGGIEQLTAYCAQKGWSITVYGPANEHIPCCTVKLAEGDPVALTGLDASFSVLDVPGHTLGHIAYLNDDILFCGDTLFSAGCGRLFDGTAQQLYHSLHKLANLPNNTKVYCTHEYTMANLAFALTVDPTNFDLINYYNRVKNMRENNLPSLPSSIGNEKQINPFLRTDTSEIMQSVSQYSNLPESNAIETFIRLRKWKDTF